MTDLEKMRAHLIEMIDIKEREKEVVKTVIIYLKDQLEFLDNLIEQGSDRDAH